MESFSAKNTINDIRNFLAGRFVGATRDEFLMDEFIKLIFCKYAMDGEETSEVNDIELAGAYRRTFKEVVKTYPDIYEKDTVEIELDPVSIKYVDTKLNELDIHNMERDIVGDAYEIFMGG